MTTKQLLKAAELFDRWKGSFALCVTLIPLGFGGFCSAQEPARLVLKVDDVSSGPFGGQKGASGLKVYSDGRVIYSSWSTSAMGVQDERGKITHPEKRESREYRFPERDSWQVSAFADFLQSKAVRRLKSYFPAPHRPIDFFETSTVELFLPNGQTKQLRTQEYYVASLVEKAKYPSALIILMDRIKELENTVVDKGTPSEIPLDCRLEHQSESGSSR